MGCTLSKPEPPKARLLHDPSKPYKYPQTQHAPSRHQPMQYAAQSSKHRQKPPRLPINARPRNDPRTQAESPPRGLQANTQPSHEPHSQAPPTHKANRKYQINNRPQRAASRPPTTQHRTPSPSPWPLSNPIPNRFENPFPAARHPHTNARKVEITMPPHSHQSLRATIAVALSPDIETKSRLSRYWDSDPVMGYGAPLPTESEREYKRLQRLSRPLGEHGRDMPEAVPRSRSASPVERKRRAKGKGRMLRLRLDTDVGGRGQQRHEEWVGGGVSPEFKRIEAIEMGVLDRAGERVREEEWNGRVRI